MRKLFLLLLAILPNPAKIWILRRRGHEIGENVYIGLCYLDIRKMILKDGVHIASFNYFKGLSEFVMLERSRISGWGNWFTAAVRDDLGNPGHGRVFIGRGSAMTNRHYFDVQDDFIVGEQTFIAGFGSVFFTHGVSPPLGNFNRSI